MISAHSYAFQYLVSVGRFMRSFRISISDHVITWRICFQGLIDVALPTARSGVAVFKSVGGYVYGGGCSRGHDTVYRWNVVGVVAVGDRRNTPMDIRTKRQTNGQAPNLFYEMPYTISTKIFGDMYPCMSHDHGI